jgi:hypothetical protein
VAVGEDQGIQVNENAGDVAEPHFATNTYVPAFPPRLT